MSETRGPSTRELISEAESLRADKKAKVPKTRQLVREAESLIGREGEKSRTARTWILLVVLALVGGGAVLFFLLSR